MNPVLMERLKRVREKSSLEKAKNSYIVTLSNIFLLSPIVCEKVCKDIGIGMEDLIGMLENPNTVDLNFLDQLLELVYSRDFHNKSEKTSSNLK